jgi:hypothetical protein
MMIRIITMKTMMTMVTMTDDDNICYNIVCVLGYASEILVEIIYAITFS